MYHRVKSNFCNLVSVCKREETQLYKGEPEPVKGEDGNIPGFEIFNDVFDFNKGDFKVAATVSSDPETLEPITPLNPEDLITPEALKGPTKVMKVDKADESLTLVVSEYEEAIASLTKAMNVLLRVLLFNFELFVSRRIGALRRPGSPAVQTVYSVPILSCFRDKMFFFKKTESPPERSGKSFIFMKTL